MIYLINSFIERNPDKPTIPIKMVMHICVFELVVTIPAYYNYILWMMTLKGIKMMSFKIWFVVSFEKPKIAYLTMSLVNVFQKGSKACLYSFSCSGKTLHSVFSLLYWHNIN